MTAAPPERAGSETSLRRPMSFSDKALAAISGSVSTSLLMTPLDVIKTRLQTQSAEQAQAASYTIRNANLGPVRGPPCPKHATVPHQVAGSSMSLTWVRPMQAYTMPYAMGESAVCIYPSKCSMAEVCEAQVILQEGRMTGILDGFVKIARVEGWRSLWRGLLPTLAMTVPSQVTYMSCYDVFRQWLLRAELRVPVWSTTPSSRSTIQFTPTHIPLLAVSLMSGAMARAIAVTIVTPLELLRTRLQASHARASPVSSVIKPLFHEVKQRGITVLWRGLNATLWRDVPFSAIYFTGYEGGKVLLTGSGFGENKASTFWHEFGTSFLAGAVSGCAAAVATHPFDLIKTRLQADHGSAMSPAPSLTEAWRDIVRSDGLAGLFRGLSPRLAKAAPACGVMIGSFEVVSRLLTSSHA
ncbi:Carrier protein, mitochondrial [Malassezia pachydermatis]|uniref:Mitochondrial carrier family protein n=1 Tax=Malassezia pachydermatis TaxID=77020 RepID=A0A0N0RSL1_9BASI|nr:mitochondrial carrier family protein [Malassezia pachydermatis]KOS15895.1 mitochondrial carrier family protein [Malassezia pachydermatis]